MRRRKLLAFLYATQRAGLRRLWCRLAGHEWGEPFDAVQAVARRCRICDVLQVAGATGTQFRTKTVGESEGA